MEKRGFGELEWAILNILKSGKRMTVKEVQKLLGEENKYTTVMTVMSRLAEKNQLKREKVGLQYEYWLQAPTIYEKVKKKVFGLKPAEMISYLIDSSEELTEEELAEIEKMIAKARKRR